MKITLERIELERKHLNSEGGQPYLDFMWQDKGAHRQLLIVHSQKSIDLMIAQFSGQVPWTEHVAFEDGSLVLAPRPFGFVIYGGSTEARFYAFPGKLLASWLAQLVPYKPIVIEPKEMKALAWQYRDRSRLSFTGEQAKLAFLKAAHGEHAKRFREIGRGDLRAAARNSNGKLRDLVVALDWGQTDGKNFYYHVASEGASPRPLYEGGWILHDSGYSSHH